MAMPSSSQHVSELLRSLKKLFESSVYTDLKIVCGNDQHQVHKAIVCLRSGRLAQLCSEIGPNKEATITIPDDDPQTIDLMLQYLYTLEYSPRLVTSSNAKPLTNGVSSHYHKEDLAPSPKSAAPTINGGSTPATTTVNGNQQQLPLQQKPQPTTAPATTLEYNIERETFENVPAGEAAAKLSKKAAKKKKRGSTDTTSTAVPEPQASAATTAPANATTNAAAQTVPPAAITNNLTKSAAAAVLPPAGPTVAPPQTQPTPPQHSLLQHAKLYTLAHKYAVPGLRALSAARFAAEAEEHWSSDDFLAAAVEAYNNTAPKPIPMTATPKQASGVAAVNSNIATKSNVNHTEESVAEDDYDDEDRLQQKSIRDVVLSNMKAHPELLDRAAVREVMKINAELSFDLMMHFRDNQQNGGSASSVVSMQSGGRYY